jgi:hypothetical protein
VYGAWTLAHPTAMACTSEERVYLSHHNIENSIS